MFEIKDGLYRYEIYNQVEGPELKLRVFHIIRLTPKGYWVDVWSVPKWVSNYTTKRFAYPTKKQALLAFTKRTERRVKILKGTLELCRVGLILAEEVKNAG